MIRFHSSGLKFLLIFEQGTLSFHFVLGLANYVSGPAHQVWILGPGSVSEGSSETDWGTWVGGGSRCILRQGVQHLSIRILATPREGGVVSWRLVPAADGAVGVAVLESQRSNCRLRDASCFLHSEPRVSLSDGSHQLLMGLCSLQGWEDAPLGQCALTPGQMAVLDVVLGLGGWGGGAAPWRQMVRALNITLW